MLIHEIMREPFYADKEFFRGFVLGLSKSSNRAETPQSSPVVNGDTVEININGMMVRKESIITKLGMGVSTEKVIADMKSAFAKGKKVQLNMDTGGGQVSGTSNLADFVYANRDKVTAIATGMVASAGFWVFASAGKRKCENTTLLGSIGVVTTVFDDSKFFESEGIISKDITSENAPNKRPDVTTEEGEAEIKRSLTSLETIFIDSLTKSLGMTRDEIINGFHQGGLITGVEAMDLGVIDEMINSTNGGVSMDIKAELEAIVASGVEKELEIQALKSEVASLKGELEAKDKAIEVVKANIVKVYEMGLSKDDVLAVVEMDLVSAVAYIENKISSEGATTTPDMSGESAEDIARKAYYDNKRKGS